MGKFTRPSGGFNRDRGDRGGFGGGRDRGDRGGRGGFGGGYGGGRDRGDRGDREMHSAVCDDCGKECKLPFRPSSDKPVYCNDCFPKHREERPKRDFGGDRRGGDRDRAPRSGVGSDLQKQIDIINTKLDRILGRLGTDMPKLAEETVEKVKEDKKTAKKEVKKEVKKEEPKKIVKKAVKKVAAKKAPAKKTTKKK